MSQHGSWNDEGDLEFTLCEAADSVQTPHKKPDKRRKFGLQANGKKSLSSEKQRHLGSVGAGGFGGTKQSKGINPHHFYGNLNQGLRRKSMDPVSSGTIRRALSSGGGGKRPAQSMHGMYNLVTIPSHKLMGPSKQELDIVNRSGQEGKSRNAVGSDVGKKSSAAPIPYSVGGTKCPQNTKPSPCRANRGALTGNHAASSVTQPREGAKVIAGLSLLPGGGDSRNAVGARGSTTLKQKRAEKAVERKKLKAKNENHTDRWGLRDIEDQEQVEAQMEGTQWHGSDSEGPPQATPPSRPPCSPRPLSRQSRENSMAAKGLPPSMVDRHRGNSDSTINVQSSPRLAETGERCSQGRTIVSRVPRYRIKRG
ncbi:unnamed protein product, partial [Discosporangium mesarthrocarpum]